MSTDLTIDLDATVPPPGSIQPGTDPDGLPRTDPTPAQLLERTQPPVVEPPKTARISKQDFDRLQSERDAFRLERDNIRTEAERFARAAQDERTGRERAEEALFKRTGQALYAHHASVQSDYHLLSSSLAANKLEREQASLDLQRATADGDGAAIASATSRLTRAETNIANLEAGEPGVKQKLEAAQAALERLQQQEPGAGREPPERQEPPAGQQPPQQRQQRPEDWIAQFPRKTTGAWLTSHQDFVTDRDKNEKFVRFLKTYAEDYGPHALHGADFVRAMDEEFLGKRDEPATADEPLSEEEIIIEEAPPTPAPQRRAAPAAPVSRAPAPARSSSSKISLTPAEQAQALLLEPDLDPKEALRVYAEGKRHAQAAGLYDAR